MEFEKSEKVELKKSTSELKEAIISIAAMLNELLAEIFHQIHYENFA